MLPKNDRLAGIFERLLFLGICMALMGCPYKSNVPISACSVSIDTSLLGSWRDTTDIYNVSKLDELHYRIEVMNVFTGKHTDTLVAHLSLVNEATYINMLSSKDKKYLIYRIDEKTPHKIKLYPISDKNQRQFSKPADLKNWIIQNEKNNSTFDSPFYLYNRNNFYSIFKPLNKSDSLKMVLKFDHEEENRINIQKAIARIEIQHEIEKKQLEDSLIKESMKKEYSFKLERERILNYSSYAGLLIITLLACIVVMHFVKKQRSERIIANEKINTLLKEQELKSVNDMLDAQESERQRIASELHDRLGSMLSTVKLYFNSVDEQIDEMKGQNRDQYYKATTLLDKACDEVRKISHDLASGELLNFGLVSALRQLGKTIEDTGSVKVNILSFGMGERLDGLVEIALYRVVQELMNNMLKHSKATEVTIQLNRTGSDLNVVVEDNGVGFDIIQARMKGGIGLQSISSRVSKLNGKIYFDTGKGRGTTTIIDIPV